MRAVKAVLPGGQETEPVDPIELQEDMLRFADNFVISTSKGAEKLERESRSIKRSELLTIKVALASDVYGIASGSNALANLVGLTVLASGTRSRVEDYWLPKVYGSSAENLLATLKEREKEIWTIAERVLNEEMIGELKEAIRKWRERTGLPEGDLEPFASNALINDVTKGFERNRQSFLPSSVFALFDIDPLAGLDPATRELTETRLFAERALFMGQRLPQLIEWQMELLSLRSIEIPEVSELLRNTSQIAGSSERLSKTLETLPEFLKSEREKVLEAFKKERSGLIDLAKTTGESFEEGTRLAKATEEALKTYQDLSKMIHDWPTDPNSPPFDIRQWGKTASDIHEMSNSMRDLFNVVLNASSDKSSKESVLSLASASKEEAIQLIDYLFNRILLLAFLCLLLIFLLRLAYLWSLSKLALNKS